MKANWHFLLIFLLSLTEQTTAQQDICPLWFIPGNTSSTGCSCQSLYPDVWCGSNYSLLHLGYCMTYNSENGVTAVRPCPFIGHYNTTSVDYVFYIQLSSNVPNISMCGPLNREGPLCGKCKDGYGIALYSYTLECSKCWGHGYGWVLYFFLELFPITVLYFLVVIFHIRATSSPLSALVFMSQIVVYTIRLNIPLNMYVENLLTGFPYVAVKLLLVLCGIWSLDFFRAVIPPFCVSSNIKTVHALALEYLVAFYPIFLISITYIFIKLHDNNFRPVVWLWKPFHRRFAYFRRRWDSTASIINAFTTFLLLSFSKILFVSFTLLYTVHIQYNYSDIPKRCVLYYDSTVQCNTQEYFLFAAIAGCVLTIFIVSPTILLVLYPTRLFRRCVTCCVSWCGFRRWHALHMFVESFQGEYKDGTNGTWDFRMVSATFFILRILTLVSFCTTSSPWAPAEWQGVLLVCATSFYAVVRPYKHNFRNIADILTLALLEATAFELFGAAYHSPTIQTAPYHAMVSVLVLGTPHMILLSYISYLFAKKAGITQCLKRKYKSLRRSIRDTNQYEEDVEADSLPDRMVNPGEYEPLLHITEGHTPAEPLRDKELLNKGPTKLTTVCAYSSIN